MPLILLFLHIWHWYFSINFPQTSLPIFNMSKCSGPSIRSALWMSWMTDSCRNKAIRFGPVWTLRWSWWVMCHDLVVWLIRIKGSSTQVHQTQIKHHSFHTMHYGSFRKQLVKYKACIFWHIFMAPIKGSFTAICLVFCVCVCITMRFPAWMGMEEWAYTFIISLRRFSFYFSPVEGGRSGVWWKGWGVVLRHYVAVHRSLFRS